MLKENCIKILGSGLSYIKTAYKNVILDIDQAEKEQKADSYTFSAEGFVPNSAEKYNLSLRSQYQVQSITPSELTHLIRTRRFSFSYANQILKTAEMLIKVLYSDSKYRKKLQSVVYTGNYILVNTILHPLNRHSSLLTEPYKGFSLFRKTSFYLIPEIFCCHFFHLFLNISSVAPFVN